MKQRNKNRLKMMKINLHENTEIPALKGLNLYRRKQNQKKQYGNKRSN